MKTAMKRVASLLLALIMILEVVAPGVVEARSAGQNRATVSDEEFIPPDGNRIDPDQNAGSHLPNFIDPDDDGYYTPPQKAPARPAQNAPAQTAPKQGNEGNDVEVSEEKAPKPLIEDEAKSKELALEFAEEKERVRVASPMNPGGLEDKKFTILTRFDTSTVIGPVKAGQTFTLHLDDKLMVKDPSTLKRLSHNGTVLTERPVYDEKANTITYKIRKDITENIQVPMAVDVDYNTANIDPNAKKFTIINKVTGIGVKDPKDLLPVVVDSNGNMLSSIIEPGRDDVIQVIQEGDNYKVNVDAYGEPVVKDREMAGIRWTVRITSDTNLKDLGLKTNFTTVKGSGLGKIENISVTNKPVPDTEFSDNPAEDNLGIVSSKHHDLNTDTKELYYTFYTPRTTKQGSYMLDLSTVLTQKYIKGTTNPVIGAVRLVLPEGYSRDQIREATPTRVGMNNRSTVMGEFTSDSTATWTVTDAVSSKDPGTLPLENRKLEGKQTLQAGGGNMAVYGIDAATGKMVQKGTTTSIGDFPEKGKNPGAQDVGTIAVYELNTKLTNPDQAEDYAVSGVAISKYQDLYIKQVWGDMPNNIPMPAQNFIAKYTNGEKPDTWSVGEDTTSKTSRNITLPGAKYWAIANDGTATRIEHKIEQDFSPAAKTINGNDYTYYENLNYYTKDEETDQKYHFIQNRAVVTPKDKPGTFDVVKVDSKDPNKKLEGARFKLNGANAEATTDTDGKATFSNIAPGSYSLIETKAPNGYKLEQSPKNVIITANGDVSISGKNASFSGSKNKTELVDHNNYPNWPDYMNAMRYGKLEDGQLNFYLYLKPRAATENGSTDKDTRLNISIPGVDVADVTAYDVSSDERATIRSAMENQTVENEIGNLDKVVFGANNNNGKITGTPNVKDPYTGRTGYQIIFPKGRFANDWGFLVKVTVNVNKDKTSVPLYYDWLTNNKDTATETKLQQLVTVNAQNDGDTTPTVTISNEAFEKQSVSVTKVDKDKKGLPGATFVLKDKNGKPISDVDTNENGTADFGELSAGKYIIEETKAPDGYIASSVVFDVTVAEDGQVTYTPRFKSGSGDPVQGTDYFIENGENSQGTGNVEYKISKNEMAIKENEPGDIGRRTGVWEAYCYESLKYSASIEVSSSKKGSRFSIQFDPNLDFKQYVNDMPKLKDKDGHVIADPYFDYTTNRLTYVFNGKYGEGRTTADINIRGIVPNKFYAKEDTKEDKPYHFETTIFPDVANEKIVAGLDKKTTGIDVQADYGRYDTNSATPAQSYYHRDIYTGSDGEYFTVLAYYNPLADNNRSPRTLRFNWLSTNFGGNNTQIARWPANGNTPAFDLKNVKIYRTPPDKYWVGDKPINRNMPLSFGVRPEQDPNTYTLVYDKTIDDPGKKIDNETTNGFTLNYDPGQIQSWGTLNQNGPLKIGMPGISRGNEGYIIEQTFKVKKGEKDKWFNLFRAFYMNNGVLESAFASKVNKNTGTVDQTTQEIPKFYEQKVKLVNQKYTAGEFSIYKYDETNYSHMLPGATFALTNDKDQTIYRTTVADGTLSFTNLPPGNYSLVETKAPKDFVKSDKNWQVTVSNTGKVTITELSLAGSTIAGDEIRLDVPNKPVGKKFRVYKKNGNGKPLPGAKFTITKKGETEALDTATSNKDGLVEFDKRLTKGNTYILKETDPPTGYKPLNQEWVVVVDQDNKAKVYNYVEGGTSNNKTKGLAAKEGTYWVDVAHRPLTGWNLYDNRRTGYVDNYPFPYKMGTRIIAKNVKDENHKYVIQRFIINPEGDQIPEGSKVQIHREKPNYSNMDWYNGRATIKAFTLNKAVTEKTVEEFRLTNYTATEINLAKKAPVPRDHEPDRLEMNLPKTNKPIVIDVELPYTSEDGGVGLGMDYTTKENGVDVTYWKSDYYEKASDIVLGEAVPTDNKSDIVGAYVSEDSLDVTNEQKKYSFKLKKVKEGDTNTTIQGATFSLKGPGENGEERTHVTDEKGIIQFDDLVEGTYKLEETSPASGYDKVNTKWTVTITKKGEVFMKEDGATGKSDMWGVAQDTSSPAHQMSRTAVLDSFLTTFGGSESPLGLGPDLVRGPVRAAADWQDIDLKRSENLTQKRVLARDDGAPANTKITEINKKDKRFRQSFLYVQGPYGDKPREIQIHREPLAYDLKKEKTNIRVYQVTGSEIGSLSKTKEITGAITFTEKRAKNTEPYRLVATLDSSYKGSILVEVETNYDARYGIGLGSNYNSNTTAQYNNKSWVADSYASEAGINKSVITYETGWEFDSVIEKPATIDVPEADKFEDETWTVQGNTGKLFKEYRYTLKDGVRTGEKAPTGNTKEDPATKADEYHHGTKKRPVVPSERTSAVISLTKDIPFKEIITEDPNLEANTRVVDVEGENGQEEWNYSITYDRKNEPDAAKPADWPQGAPQPEKQEGERIASYNAVFVKTTKQAKDQQVRVGKKETTNPGTEIPAGKLALIKNKQTGLDVKIFKKNELGDGLKDAIFTLKETESDYKTDKPNGINLTAMSDDEGRLIIIDNADDKKPVDPQPKIKAGYYVLKEDTAPVGYKKITAPWNIHVREDKNGQLVADYFGPEDTASSYLNHVRMEDGKLVDKAMVNELTERNSGIKYASRVVNIDPEAKTFRQRLYLDTRDTNQVINVQINPVNKRDERDFVPDENGAKRPKTLAEGVKTAYRTTYKLANPGTITKEKANEILKSYDLSKPGVSMVNTARWRPFDWGFDEDQLNLEPGVYFIDVEGYYDDNIVNGDNANNVDKGKIKIKFDFFSGKRQFKQIESYDYATRQWKWKEGGSYQAGNEAAGFGKDTQWGKLQDKANNQKYPNWLSKVFRWNGYVYRNGKISPSIEEGSEGYVPPRDTIETSIDINPLYTSSKTRSIPESGMIITDEEESYNITFSKHGKDGDDESWNNTGENVANNRLEGAVFKLQQYTPTSNNFEDVKGTYVASAFNGYFGFRGLKPGRYRLMEVKAPEGYSPIKEAILYMTISYKDGEPDKDTGNITPGKGQITLEYNKNVNGIIQYVDAKNKPMNAQLVDFVTSGTAKNMGKIVNTKPGKGNVTVTKVDENGVKLPSGAKFQLTRLALDGKTDAQGKNQGVLTGTVDTEGKLNFSNLGIGNYRLEEISPHPGHINNRMVWNFTVGGKDIDPYAEDTNKPTRDITKSIKLDKSDVKVQKYMGEDNTQVDDNIYPHKAQSVRILSDFSLNDKTLTIQPGDYFTVKVSNSIDLMGIYKNRTVANLNIFADGVGTIAKGKYDKETNTITYTFTNYAKNYSLENFKTQLVAWINLEEIKEDKMNVPVGIGLGGKDLKDDKLQTKPLNVYYDIEKETSSHPDYKKSRFNQNITGKIYELNPKTGEFVQYYYINRQRHDGRYMPKFRFYANQYLYDVHISIDKLKNNTEDLKTWMPASFAVPAFNNDGLTPIERYDRNWISEYWYNFSNTPDEGMGEDDSYIVTVRGKVNPETAKELHTYGDLLLYNSSGYEFGRVSREDWAYFDENKTEAKAALSIRAVNPKNKVVFEKVDADGKPLEGAKFTLYTKKGDNYETGQNDTHVSGKDGLITFEGLDPGEYRITETDAPDGYVINKDILLEFTVNEDGKIIKKVKVAENKIVDQVEDGNVPIRVVNHKPVVFTKVDGLDGNALQGAEFEVWYKKTKDTLKYSPYKEKDANGQDTDKTLTVTSGKDGKIKLELYKSGYYALKETKAPDSYIKPSPMSGYVKEFVIQDDGILVKEPLLVQGTKQGDPTQDGNQAIDMYFVVNPYHKKMTDSATFTMDVPKDGSVKNDDITIYALDSGDKIADDKKLNKPTEFNSKMENGKLTVTLLKPTVNEGEESGKAKKKLVIKVPMTVKGKGEVTIPTATTFNGDTTEATYRFDPVDLKLEDDTFTNAKNSLIYREYRTAETTDGKTTNPASYDIENYKGTYPFTGGFGPNRWIVIIGAVIAAIAAEEYIRRKRSSAEPKGGA